MEENNNISTENSAPKEPEKNINYNTNYNTNYYKNDKKVLNKVLYNIKITIFVPEIKSESLFDRTILSMSN